MHQRRRQLRKPRPRSLQKRDTETSQDSREPTFDFVDPARAFGTPNSPGRMSVNNRRPRSLPVLRPITSFSPVEEGSNPASLPAQATALSSRAIINSTSIINILIHLLCKQQESDPARRKLLFSAFCTMIEQINTSLYLPPQALTQLQGFPASVLEEFENLFKEVQSQFATSSASLAVPSLQYPPNPVGRLSGLYEQLWDDRYSREFLENGVLGMGGFGVVMEAKNKLDGQLYAVKMIDIGKQSSGLNHKILLREVQALAQLEHPNIVRYYSTWLQWYCIPHQLPDHPYTVNSSHQSTQVPIRSMCKFGALGACPQVTIQELSSSETESEAFDEASDGIVFRDDSTFQKSVSSIYESSTKCTVKVEEKLEVTSSCREKNNVESSSSASVDSCEQENNHMKMEIFSDALRNFGHCSSLYPLDISYHSPKFSSALKKRTCAGKALKKNGANNREFLGGIRNHKDNSFFNSTSDTSSSSSSDEDFRICFRKNVTGINSTEDSNSSSSSSKDDYKYTGSLQRYCSTDRDTKRPPRVPSMTLFIQMGLCKGSLKDWLINRNESPTPLVNHAQCLGFIKQILSGVEYIHTQNIIHRDLKPANIFFSQDGNHLLIGDFGLARPLSNGAHATRVSDVGNSISPIPEHAPNTCDIGTPIYTAPEVKTGDKYGFKSDVHNLGIILLELFQPFQTGFERIHVIDALKVKRHLDQSLICHWPDIAPWILKLTDPDPDKRPLPSDVLKSILFHPLHPDRRYCKVPNSQGSDASTVLSMPVSVNSKYFDEHKYLSSLQKQMEPRPVSNIQDTHQDCEASSSTDISASDSLHMQKRLYATELYQKDIEIARLREENQELHKIIEKLQHQVKCFNGLTECKKL